MSTLKIERGKHFIHAGDKQNALYVILQGSIEMLTNYDTLRLEAGNIIGLMAASKQKFQCDYIAAEDALVMSYDYQKEEDLEKIFQLQPKYANVFAIGAIKQANMVLQNYHKTVKTADTLYRLAVESHRDYKYFCTKYEIPEKSLIKIDNFERLGKQQRVPAWYVDYYQALSKKTIKEAEQFYGNAYAINAGEIYIASEIMEQAVKKTELIWEYLQYWRDILLNETRNDLCQLYFDLEARVSSIGASADEVHERITKMRAFIENAGIYEQDLCTERFDEYDHSNVSVPLQEMSPQQNTADGAEPEDTVTQSQGSEYGNNLRDILLYAGYEKAEIHTISSLIQSYCELPDMYSTEDSVRKLRKELSRVFYETYKRVMYKILQQNQDQPVCIKLFLNFGYMGKELLGAAKTKELIELKDYLFSCNSENVYTMYEWLKSIYEGRNEPCRNEFDLDYIAYLNDLKKSGRITQKEQQEWKDNAWKKVEFEIENMFTSANRAVYGRISTFVPMMCEHDVINSARQMLVTVNKIENSLDMIRQTDFSIFYRDIVFSDPQHDVTREFLKKEILPDVILMPNAGTRAMMWQETNGSRRDTPARFLFPIMTTVDLDALMIETAGRFRWEMCRKEQGMRWNDIREPSLTSEYYDYVQFYRKNHELSAEAKEKMKNLLWKAKNNYREVFVKDYQDWIKYEAKGSFRLNKVSREILFRYCPFVKATRESLKTNPMYQEMINRYEILNGRQKRHVELFEDKYLKAGGSMDESLQENKQFYEM